MECYNFSSSIRGYHVFKFIWKYEIGDKLDLKIEENNPRDKYAVKLILLRGKADECVGHVPMEFSKVFHYFLKRGGTISAEVTGEKFFDNGLEIPCVYKFVGTENDIKILAQLLK